MIDLTLAETLTAAMAIAQESRAARLRTALPAKPVRRIARNCDEASALAGLIGTPVDFMHGKHQCSVWPMGTTPPMDF